MKFDDKVKEFVVDQLGAYNWDDDEYFVAELSSYLTQDKNNDGGWLLGQEALDLIEDNETEANNTIKHFRDIYGEDSFDQLFDIGDYTQEEDEDKTELEIIKEYNADKFTLFMLIYGVETLLEDVDVVRDRWDDRMSKEIAGEIIDELGGEFEEDCEE